MVEDPKPENIEANGLDGRPLSEHEVEVVVGAIADAAADGELLPDQTMVIEAVALALSGHSVDPRRCDRLSPDELAAVMNDHQRSLAFRHRIVRYMSLVAILIDPIPDDLVDRVAAYAAALGVGGDCTMVASQQGQGRRNAVLTDFARNGYSEEFMAQGHSHVLHAKESDVGTGWGAADHDPELAARWEALADCPDGSLGQAVADFYRSRHFNYPGTPEAAPPLLAQHAWVHVLADYGTRVSCEIEVFGLIGDSVDDRGGFSLLAMAIGLFATGSVDKAAGLFEADPGHLNDLGMATRLADALRRGTACTKPDGTRHGGLMSVDWFAYADQPLDEVRRLCNIAPKSQAAIDAGSPATFAWEGLSDYQREHCDLDPFARHQS